MSGSRTVGADHHVRAAAREARRLVGSVRFIAKQRGARYLAGDALDLARSYAAYPLRARGRRRHTFVVGGETYRYFVHHYNRAWRNERTVELALATEFVGRRRGTRLLEIGNVLAHYGVGGHDVLDKYEVSPGVMNDDVAAFSPPTPYESIVSISTLEHVGWDERPREPGKTLRACENMLRALAPGGQLLLTTALGQNPYLDAFIEADALPFENICFLRRTNAANDWIEVSHDDAIGSRYGHPFRNGNVLLVARSTRSYP